jgi:hypothetical protein
MAFICGFFFGLLVGMVFMAWQCRDDLPRKYRKKFGGSKRRVSAAGDGGPGRRERLPFMAGRFGP